MKHPRLILSCSAALGIPLAWICMTANVSLSQSAPALPPPLVQPPETSPAAQQPAPAAVDLADNNDDTLLGRPYESESAGLSFRPPVDCKLVNSISSEFVAEWADPHREWTLKLGKMVLDAHTPLVTSNGVEGVLDKTVKNLQARLPGGKILRQDVTNTRDGGRIVAGNAGHAELIRDNVGLIIIRYTIDGRRRLSQQALIQTSEGLYDLLTLTTPGSNALEADDKAPVDPGELAAVETFNRMIDSIHMLDRKAIRADQDTRLYHTRTAIVNWTPEKLHRLINEQWVRIIRNGKDIGYSYITEDNAGGIPKPLTRDKLEAAMASGEKDAERKNAPRGDGILIGVRTRMITEGIRSDKTKGPIQTDTASWKFVSADKKHEDFSGVAVTDDHIAPKKGYVQEFGVSNKRVGRVVVDVPVDPTITPGAIQVPDGTDKTKTLAFKEDWELDVNQTSNVGMAPPLIRKLPPWYIPQALAHLLPRLLPLDKPQGYVFAVYVSDAGEVVMRYIDVLPEQNVTFAGQSFRAVPIHDRLGLEGAVTIHYMNLDGVYLGSENKEQKLVMLPTNDTTLKHIWADANLSRPGGIEHGGPANAALINPTGSGEIPPR